MMCILMYSLTVIKIGTNLWQHKEEHQEYGEEKTKSFMTQQHYRYGLDRTTCGVGTLCSS